MVFSYFRLSKWQEIVAIALFVAVTTCLSTDVVLAQVAPLGNIDPTQNQRRQSERDRAAQEKQESRVDIQSPQNARVDQSRVPAAETPCFHIAQINLRGDAAERFKWVLNRVNGAQNDDTPFGKCLGAEGINVVLKRAQDALIEEGFITSRLLAEPQDLKTGVLNLTVVPGRIRTVRFAYDTSMRATARNAVPILPGDILNLRDIEQGLENFKRVPTAEADIKIEPANGADTPPGYSDLVITWRQGNPFRVSVSTDDSGSKGTGKYQGSLTLSYDNLFTLNDLFYITLNRDLGGADNGPRGTKARTVHYSIPFGYWALSTTASNSRYFQTVFGASQDYIYSGTSSNTDIKLSRVVYRDANRKTIFAVRAFQRKSNNFIDDTEVQVQQRAVGGWEANVNHREFFGAAVIDANLAYKRGTGAFGSIPAPEEAFGEGTSRFVLITADVNVSAPFTISGQKLRYSSAWRIQNNRTPLTPQDRFAIGSRFSVRGFDGEGSLSAERGWTVRNEVAIPVGQSGQDLYTGLDFGHVSGPSSDKLVGKSLAGAVVGARGSLRGVQYEIFVATPVRKPAGFRTAGKSAGFNLNYNF